MDLSGSSPFASKGNYAILWGLCSLDQERILHSRRYTYMIPTPSYKHDIGWNITQVDWTRLCSFDFNI
jgi:hypothetical protein